jgi:hypothetical protein
MTVTQIDVVITQLHQSNKITLAAVSRQSLGKGAIQVIYLEQAALIEVVVYTRF